MFANVFCYIFRTWFHANNNNNNKNKNNNNKASFRTFEHSSRSIIEAKGNSTRFERVKKETWTAIYFYICNMSMSRKSLSKSTSLNFHFPIFQSNNIDYNTEVPEELKGKIVVRCRVQMQKETGDCLMDELCNEIAPRDYAGYCKYVFDRVTLFCKKFLKSTGQTFFTFLRF